MKIVIDPGHGGSDPGAVSKPLIESHLNLELALIVYATLAAEKDNNGDPIHEIYFTRTIDEGKSTSTRAHFANNHGADLFISLHHNAYRSRKAHGFEILVYRSGSIAEKIAKSILKLLKWNIFNRGVKFRPHLSVLKRTSMPAILIEAGFISSDIDREDTLLDRIHPEQKRWVFYCDIADAIKQSISEGG